MVDRGSGRGGGRPFYELPSHVKPCSQIIQETRLQLKYSSSARHRAVSTNSSPPNPLPVTPTPTPMNGSTPANDWELDVTSSNYGMRPVHTKRPFTPRDSASLWGKEARKRPPSAITLSRLSQPVEEFGDQLTNSRPGSRSNSSPSHTFGVISTTSGSGGGSKGRLMRSGEARNSLGSLSSASGGSLAGIAESDGDEPTTMIREGQGGHHDNQFLRGGRSSAENGEGTVEKVRLEMKSLSLQNVTSTWSALGELGDGDETLSKKWRQSDLDPVAKGSLSNGGHGHEDDPYQNINNLEVALEYLSSFVTEYGSNSEHPPRVGDVVSILKSIRVALTSGGGGGPSGVGDGWDETNISSKLRKTLLELIFKLVEKNQNDTAILFWSSFVLLHCNIVGNNLTTVFKMVFKSSKSKEFKDIILGTEYLEILMKSFSQICPKTQTESMIYGYGTLKFFSGDQLVLNRLVDLNLIPIMALHLKILNCEIDLSHGSDVNFPIPEGILNGTFQLTSILRSVVGESRTLFSLVQSGLLSELCTTLTWALGDVDVLTNIVRILSVVSMDGVCCEVMVNNPSLTPTVVRVLGQWMEKEDVIVRLAFCLGNLLAHNDDMRINLFEEPSAFQGILRVMNHYLDKTPPTSASIDILIKTTRVIANWILNPFVGSEVCDDPSLSDVLYSTLTSAGGGGGVGTSPASQELILCVMCALNNTSFYINYTQLDEGTLNTAQYLFQTLPDQEVEVRAESVKVLGNLTRNEDVRLMSTDYMENILLSLDKSTESSPELLCATCGVLINIVIEERVKNQFLKERGVERVITVLELSDDMMVSLITCQVLWNLLISHENQGVGLPNCIPPLQIPSLKATLMEKVEKVGVGCNLDHGDEACNCNTFSNLQLITQDFLQVAKDLVAKL